MDTGLTHYLDGTLDMTGEVLAAANEARVAKRLEECDALLALWDRMRDKRKELALQKYPEASALELFGAGLRA